VGHSTSGELAFMSMGEKGLSDKLKGRFLGWGSGGPANIRKECNEEFGKRQRVLNTVSKYPPLEVIRSRDAEEYVKTGYIGPLNPCGTPKMKKLDVAKRWFKLVQQRRPNVKQVLQDTEHWGTVEIRSNIISQINQIIAKSKLSVKAKDVLKDLFAANSAPLTGYKKMVWVVGKWDKTHWDKKSANKSLELYIANQFRKQNPGALIRVLLFDLPMVHYGHIEMPKQVASGLITAALWLIK
jgi:hypothetical protein